MNRREYFYVGPDAIREAAIKQPTGTRILTTADLRSWLATADIDRLPDGTVMATFTISLNYELFLAPRRSEHVACAAGGPVLSAGEVAYDESLRVTEITNQSTGFCPEPESWSSVETALNRIGLDHPDTFTTEIIYRLCPACHQRNAVKDAWYYCAVCDAKLPEQWNFGP